MNVLTINDLSAGYGKSQILFDVSIGVKEGSITCILGPNGSGKSTLLKSIFGLTKIYKGSIKFDSKELVGLKPFEIVKLGIAYIPQVGNVYENLTVKENLIMASYILSKEEAEERIEEALEFIPVLRSFLNRKVYTLSGGERQMLAICMALILKPKLIMFDEPSANLAPKMVDTVFNKIRELNESGLTILLVEQNVRKALQISEYANLLVSGRVRFSGKSEDLAKNPDFGKLFLGLK